MQRRHLLAGAATVALQSLLWPLVPGRAAATVLPNRRVRPSDPLWPSAASWRALNEAVGGNLIKVSSLLESCDADRSGAKCSETIKQLSNPLFIGDQAGGTQVSGWLDAWSPAPSIYAVAARNAADVVAAVNFARTNNLRLVVKGGGHSYQGTSNAPDSLLIWTRSMKNIVLHDAFVAQGCEKLQRPQPAVTIDAGAMWIDAYDAVTTKAGRYVQGGGCTTVGVAGLIQSGGFGSFSKGFGTAAAGLLETEIVTADGKVRTVNACADPELFWAIKGGGGGSWGVITRITLRTHVLPTFFGGANGAFKARSDLAFRRLIGRFVDFYGDHLCNPHWGEQVAFGLDNTLRISMVFQGLDDSQVADVWQPFIDWIKTDADLTVAEEFDAGGSSAQHWWDAVARKRRGNDSMISDSRAGSPETHAWWSGDQEQVGALLYAYESAWLPSSLLRPENRKSLADALFAASRHRKVELHFNKGLAGAPAEALTAAADTATNPQVLGAFALAIIAGGGRPAYPGLPDASTDPEAARKSRREVASSMQELYRVAPGAGSYVSESNYFEQSWQQSYWGKHYARLRAVKAKCDPAGLFFVHNGVGSEDWSADGFTRLGKG
jgi:FAD/FMN-containing dehydrogenase